MEKFIVGKVIACAPKSEPIETYKVDAYDAKDAAARYYAMFRPSHMWMITVRKAA